MKQLFIAEKPSVARQFAEALEQGQHFGRQDGYLESERYVVTWCLGHLVTMSYPDAYDARLKFWRYDTLPFLPSSFKYEIIGEVKKQFHTVSGLLRRQDISCIYVCTDSGREGEYIYRLVDQMAGVGQKEKRRVWIDSQTKEEILRGIREARPESDYDSLAASAFCRAKEDYLMGINFSRALTLRYGKELSARLGREKTVISAGRVMTCVLGMVVRREEEIRAFQKTTFYKIRASLARRDALAKANAALNSGSMPSETLSPHTAASLASPPDPACFLEAEFQGTEESRRYAPTDLYKNSGFLKKEKAEVFVQSLSPLPREAVVEKAERKREQKYAPLLYNLAELQNDCSRFFKISPEEALAVAQGLYEKKMITYPRTDARVLSSAIAKEIGKNLKGLSSFPAFSSFTQEILSGEQYKKIGKGRYTDDKQITDHYAIIPTGQGMREYPRLQKLWQQVYTKIVQRFLAIFYPPAVYQKLSASFRCEGEAFACKSRVLLEPGYLRIYQGQAQASAEKALQGGKTQDTERMPQKASGSGLQGAGGAFPGTGSAGMENIDTGNADGSADTERGISPEILQMLKGLRKGQKLWLTALSLREGETSPPKRYNSGSIILAMENAGKLIEDAELREQIRGCGIGTSATRASILQKLVKIDYLALNKKTQILSPTRLGEMVTMVVRSSVKQLLDPELTASWEKGLSYVAGGSITEQEYMEKLRHFVGSRTAAIIRGSGVGFPVSGK